MRIASIATLAIALCAVSAPMAKAQGTDGPPPGARRGGMMGGRALEGITLTDAQKAQQTAIREKYMPKMTEMRQQMMASGGPPDSASRAAMMTLSAQYNADIRAILTPDQQKVFDKNIADEKDRMAKRQPPPGN